MLRRLLLASASVLSLSSYALGANYTLDPVHSSIEFKVKHLVISTVKGSFKDFKGTGSGTFTNTQAIIDSIQLEINPASIDTSKAERDNHLKSPDLLNVEKFKTMSFNSVKVDYQNKMPTKIHGNFTLHGVTKPLVLNVKWGGVVTDPFKNERVAFEVDGVIKRSDYGMTWNKLLETGGAIVGDDVKIEATIEAIRNKDEKAQK